MTKTFITDYADYISGEIWAVAVGYQYYLVSNYGNVLNLTNAQLTDTATVDLQILSGTWYATRSCNISVTQPSQAMQAKSTEDMTSDEELIDRKSVV